jgi:hypothetical protein
VRFQVLTAAVIKMTVFWDVASCGLVEVYRRFTSACCLLALMMEAESTSETDYTEQQKTDSHLQIKSKRMYFY